SQVTITVTLNGACNDAEALATALCYAAKAKCDARVILGTSFPRAGFMRLLDAASWEVARRGLPCPAISVERRREPPEPLPRHA
ncbi:MAG: hypothetical protein JOZ39_11200, partial [Chloroflexi bacterium]|nr:hypothetical protein [Chloroflexota bacterium]